ncbi:MAG TPA: hypothetical protein VNZ52_04515 [Candidatus Thermoplasmatota archaeon]|nr:hypothetical protein [Candidatus Thermoplasmatota archaeon]
MRVILVATLILAAGFAGCLNEPEPEPAAEQNTNTTPEILVDENRPDPTAGEVVAGPAAEPDLEATLAAAPKLKVGEWWKIKFSSPLDGTAAEFYRVVAKEEQDHYIFGMPHEGWYKEAVIYHTPAFGEVNKADLSYDTHDVLFTPLKFPLTEDQTWTTSFSGGPDMQAKVKVVDQYVAEVTFTNVNNGNPLLSLVYDARMHEVVKIDHFTVQFEVVEHGYDFKGWVTVPRAEDLVFIHARFGGILSGGPAASGPTDTVEITEDYNRVTFVQIVGLSVVGDPGGTGLAHQAGVYRETVTDPQGNKYETMVTPADGGYKVNFFEVSDPKGVWTLEHIAAGPGLAFTEGIAYHQYDILVPEGRIRTDHSHPVVR